MCFKRGVNTMLPLNVYADLPWDFDHFWSRGDDES